MQDVVMRESSGDAAATLARIEAALAEAGVPVFAKIDHAANARGVGEVLRPTTVLIFGNPRVGTRLMQENQAIGLDLPLRMLVWEDAAGRGWIGYPQLEALAARYGIADAATIAAMAGFMDRIAGVATGA